MNLRTVLREPLLHFLLIGAGLFALYGHVSPGDGDSRRIVVDQRQVDNIVEQYRLQWNRPPTASELRTLVDTQVHDEIIYREGKALGLDRDDAVIRRRVRQKYELMAEEEGALAAPTDAQLEVWRRTRPAAFLKPAVISFDQLFFDPATTNPQTIATVRSALAGGAAPAGRGQASLLPASVVRTPLDLVARDFGEGFAASVGAMPVGEWAGPVRSGYGVHLVRVSARTLPDPPPLDAVRQQVAREWESNQRNRARDANYARLRRDYDVVIQVKLP